MHAASADLVVSVKNTKYSTTHLKGANGELAIRMTNHDLFWHTMTIDGLGVDMHVPVGATRRVHFRARAGRYEYYCRIPGHKSAGMHGTLVVS